MTSDQSADRDSQGPESRIGKYRLLDLVGRGAMGKVYAAHDELADRKVAIKFLMADLEGEPDVRARFFREAQAAARLGHRNVITIYDVSEDHGRPFIVMELLRGLTLDKFLKKATVDLERKVDVMIQLCEAMTAAHAAGIIHRDLKPGNLFVQFDGLLKVLDFGVARLASSSMTRVGAQPGTLQFMSPEQARGEDIDNRSDIFSAGGVFYCMLTGRKPFPGEEWMRVIRMLQFEAPTALTADEAPQPLAAIVMRCLEKDAAARYQRFEHVAADLMRFQREYQAETRRLLDTTSATYRTLTARLAAVRTASSAVGEAAVPGSPCLDQLNETYPVLRDRGTEGFRLIPFTRNRLLALKQEFAREIVRLEQHERDLGQLSVTLAAGNDALSEGRYHVAVRAFEKALARWPQCQPAREGLEQSRSAIADQEAGAQRVKRLLREAQAAAHSQDWEQVVAICDQILTIDRTVPLAVALREAGRVAIEQARLQADRAQRSAIEPIRVARARFRRGQTNEAFSGLRDALRMGPATKEIHEELNRLTAMAALWSTEAAKRANDARQHCNVARTLLEADALDPAVQAALRAVECDATDNGSITVLCEAIERDGAARIENERQQMTARRQRAAASVLDIAQAAIRRGDLVRAAAAAENAVRLSPLPEATAMLERLRAALSSDGSNDVTDEIDLGTAAVSTS